MAPRIFTLLPLTGTSGGQPTRLQVACKVESCRKLASSDVRHLARERHVSASLLRGRRFFARKGHQKRNHLPGCAWRRTAGAGASIRTLKKKPKRGTGR